MLENPTHEERIEAAVERIQDAVADLPNAKEKREAETQALVSTVPKELPYLEQIHEFTAITHAMRVLMAGQLTPSFRQFLVTESPRPLSAAVDEKDVDPKVFNADLAGEKERWADSRTDEIFRLGLAISLRGNDVPCHLGTTRSKGTRGRYRLLPDKSSSEVANFTDLHQGRSRKWGKDNVEIIFNDVFLVDAAPPDGRNGLTPRRG